MTIALVFQVFGCLKKKRGFLILSQSMELPLLFQPPERRLLFNGEFITGKMFGGKCLCPFECFFPVPQGLALDAINQIHANVFESHLSKGGEGGFIFCRGLSPTQEREDFIIERLNTQTDPVKTKNRNRAILFIVVYFSVQIYCCENEQQHVLLEQLAARHPSEFLLHPVLLCPWCLK